MSDFLLELRCEEIPARMQAKARVDLEKLFTAQISAAGLKADSIEIYSTPRRLALIARGLPDQTEAVSEERKGPAANAPEQALAGFLRSTGLSREDLVEREVKGKAVLFAITEKPGQPTNDILASAIPAIIAAFPWPKSQRWGAASISSESMKWVRPLSSIMALFGGEIVPCDVHGIKSGRLTKGHRFHSADEISINDADDYAAKLRDAYVLVDHQQRQDIIRDGAAKAAHDAGLTLVEDEGLVIENAGLTEWPVPLLGRFDASFLDVPEEVIQLTTRINQKYFVVRDNVGALTNAFVCTANIDAIDGGKAIVAGNEKVLAARLADAKFFWELDQKTTLAVHAEKLSNIVFHEKLGTVADKVDRVAKLARWLCTEGIIKPSTNDSVRPEPAEGQGGEIHASTSSARTAEELADLAEQAARLCKADLVTEMVGEFPELQGLMGGYYAAKEGLPSEVSDAIRDHYKPVGQSDDVPTAPVTVAVSLADKLDTIYSFFAIDEKPTGSKDPFALRRAALSIIRLFFDNNLRVSLIKLFSAIDWKVVSDSDGVTYDDPTEEILKFTIDRLKVQQKEAGVRHDLIDAVFVLGGEDDIVRLLARVHALQAFVTTDDGVNLLAGYKRASNILKKETPDMTSSLVIPAKAGIQSDNESLSELDSRLRENDDGESSNAQIGNSNSVRPEPVEGKSANGLRQAQSERMLETPSDEPEQSIALQSALIIAETKASSAIAAEDFEGAMSALASLRTPIDSFFEAVMVNDDNAAKKQYRLGLLSRFRDAVHSVADFSKIVG